jgi:hypothetical protein
MNWWLAFIGLYLDELYKYTPGYGAAYDIDMN